MHWVKGHVGIVGNEIADKSANMDIKTIVVFYNQTSEECFSNLNKIFLELWDIYWKESAEMTQKGLFLKNIKNNIKQKIPQVSRSQDGRNRRAEIVINCLWMGHVGLNYYLYRFNTKESNLCEECKAPETVEHFILYCKIYNEERANMIGKLGNCNVFGLS